MTAAARRTAAAERRGGRRRGKLLTGLFLRRRRATTMTMPNRGTSTISTWGRRRGQSGETMKGTRAIAKQLKWWCRLNWRIRM